MGRYGSTRYFVSKKEPDPGKGSAASLKKSGRWKQWENSKQPVIWYDQYRLNGWEIILGLGKGSAACGLLSYTFFRSFQIFLWMMPFSLIGLVIERQYRLERRQKELAGQFKEGIMLLASSLSAGFSIENALAASVEELSMLYGSNGLIVREFNFMVQQIRTNRPVEQVLEDFSARSGLEDVQNFAEVFTMKKFGKKQLVLASMVLALGAAVYLNWQFAGVNKLPVGDTSSTVSQLGAAQLVNNTYVETVSDDLQQRLSSGSASTTFSEARLNRQNSRDEAMEMLDEVLESVEADSDAKKEAVEQASAIAQNILKETNVENLLQAKGYQETVAYFSGEECSVVVGGEIKAEDTLIIQEVVMDQTGLSADKITIVPAK